VDRKSGSDFSKGVIVSFLGLSVPCHSWACPSHVILGLVRPMSFLGLSRESSWCRLLMGPRHKAKDDNRGGVAYLWILGIKPRMTIGVVSLTYGSSA
jgi:hypothetical protein